MTRQQIRILYDGDCGFCTSSVPWAERSVRPEVRFVPWQTEPATLTDPLRTTLEAAVVAVGGDVVVASGGQTVVPGAGCLSAGGLPLGGEDSRPAAGAATGRARVPSRRPEQAAAAGGEIDLVVLARYLQVPGSWPVRAPWSCLSRARPD